MKIYKILLHGLALFGCFASFFWLMPLWNHWLWKGFTVGIGLSFALWGISDLTHWANKG